MSSKKTTALDVATIAAKMLHIPATPATIQQAVSAAMQLIGEAERALRPATPEKRLTTYEAATELYAGVNRVTSFKYFLIKYWERIFTEPKQTAEDYFAECNRHGWQKDAVRHIRQVHEQVKSDAARRRVTTRQRKSATRPPRSAP